MAEILHILLFKILIKYFVLSSTYPPSTSSPCVPPSCTTLTFLDPIPLCPPPLPAHLLPCAPLFPPLPSGGLMPPWRKHSQGPPDMREIWRRREKRINQGNYFSWDTLHSTHVATRHSPCFLTLQYQHVMTCFRKKIVCMTLSCAFQGISLMYIL